MRPLFRHSLPLLSSLLLCTAAYAQKVEISNPWVRATVAAQKVTGAFMSLQADQDVRLIEVQSPVASSVEVHKMEMNNNVMTMRAIPALDLPAGQAVELKPGGYHIMLMGLKAPIKDGESVPLTLVIEGRDKKTVKVEVAAPARAMAPAEMHHHH